MFRLSPVGYFMSRSAQMPTEMADVWAMLVEGKLRYVDNR